MTKQLSSKHFFSRSCATLLGAICLLQVFPDAIAESFDASLGLPRTSTAVELPTARLGESLFFDTRLSADRSVSCATCHQPEHAFADTKARSQGHRKQTGTRNAPSLLNVAYLDSLFWDGRAASLEDQAHDPFINPVEHGLPNHQKLLEVVRSDQAYFAEFSRLWPAGGVTLDTVSAALAAYERTLVSAGSRFDRHFYGKDRGAMSEAALRGMELFRGRANCGTCHTLGDEFSLFTDQSFHLAARGVPAMVSANLPTLAQRAVAARGSRNDRDLDELIATDAELASLGRFLVTLEPSDIGKFKTPSLRNVAETAPYMHDGSVATLEEAVELELYSRGAVTYPIVLTRSEKADLIDFLKSLSGAPEGRSRSD